MKSKALLVFGEVLFDIIEGESYLGGAPFNVAAHFARHQNRTVLISAVGNDILGEKVKSSASDYGVSTELLQINAYPTGLVNVTLYDGQPSYEIVENVAWDSICWTSELEEYISQNEFDCFYFGMLAQRSETNQSTLNSILNSKSFGTIFFDVNLRKHYYTKYLIENSLKHCTILKINDEEVNVISDLLFGKVLDFNDFAVSIRRQFDVEIIIVTLGKNGAAYFSDKENGVAPGIKVDVADTVGAGDSFSAAFLNAYLKGETIENSVRAGCKLGAYVASQKGAIPD